MNKKNLIRVLGMTLIMSMFAGSYMHAWWGLGGHRGSYGRGRYGRGYYGRGYRRHSGVDIAVPLIGSMMLAGALSASKSEDTSSLRSDLNEAINALNSHATAIRNLDNALKSTNREIDDLQNDVERLEDKVKELSK